MQYLVLLGAAFNLVTTIIYIKDVLKGKVKPNKVTWLMWSVAPLIGTAAAVSEGVTWAAVPVFVSGFFPLLIFISSFINKDAYWKMSKFDIACGAFSLIALIIWYLTGDAVYAIVFALASDGAAALPTIFKSWKYPETENMISYLGGMVATSTAAFAIENWNFVSVAFPAYIFLLDAIILFVLVYKGKRNRRSK